MHTTDRHLVLARLALVVFVAFGGQAFSSTVAVGTCTSLVNFATIQQAIDAVPSGSTIKICPGTYKEQLHISQPVTLTGLVFINKDLVVVAPPATGMVQNAVSLEATADPIAAQVWVHDNAGPVNINNLTVDGSGNGLAGCGPDLMGVLYQNASGTMNHIAVRNETLGAGLGGCQSGQGIFVQSSGSSTSTVSVLNSSVHKYNKNGITGNDDGTNLTVSGSYVQGSGVVAVPGAAQNGIQLAFGAKGKISGNTVVDNIYGDPNVAASANILLYDTAAGSGTTVSTNTLGNSQLPIGLFADGAGLGDGVTVNANKIFGTATYDGIDVCTNGNTVTKNMIFNSAESGIHLDASCGGTGNSNIVTQNTIVESACAGVLSDPGTTSNMTTPNTFFTIPFPNASSTSGCTIPGNGLRNRANTRSKYSPAR